jgi:hypothetical protein
VRVRACGRACVHVCVTEVWGGGEGEAGRAGGRVGAWNRVGPAEVCPYANSVPFLPWKTFSVIAHPISS